MGQESTGGRDQQTNAEVQANLTGDQRPFALDRDSYSKDFEPVYKREFAPQTILQFPVILPYHIPVVDGTCITVFLDTGTAHTYHFSTVNTVQRVDPGILTPKPISVPVKKSRVEMMYATADRLNLSLEHDLTDYFDQLLDILNYLLTSYLVLFKDVDVHRLAKEMFQFACMARVTDVATWQTSDNLFLLHMDVPYERKALAEDEHDRLVWFLHVLRKEMNPFLISEELLLNARRYLKDGFYREAVLFGQMAVEAFLNVLFEQLLISEGSSPEDAEKVREGLSFIRMVKSEFHPRLGGRWKLSDTSSATGAWYEKAYKLRNRIAHGGYVPRYAEVDEALTAGTGFRAHILGLIKSGRAKYPGLMRFFEQG